MPVIFRKRLFCPLIVLFFGLASCAKDGSQTLSLTAPSLVVSGSETLAWPEVARRAELTVTPQSYFQFGPDAVGVTFAVHAHCALGKINYSHRSQHRGPPKLNIGDLVPAVALLTGADDPAPFCRFEVTATNRYGNHHIFQLPELRFEQDAQGTGFAIKRDSQFAAATPGPLEIHHRDWSRYWLDGGSDNAGGGSGGNGNGNGGSDDAVRLNQVRLECRYHEIPMANSGGPGLVPFANLNLAKARGRAETGLKIGAVPAQFCRFFGHGASGRRIYSRLLNMRFPPAALEWRFFPGSPRLNSTAIKVGHFEMHNPGDSEIHLELPLPRSPAVRFITLCATGQAAVLFTPPGGRHTPRIAIPAGQNMNLEVFLRPAVRIQPKCVPAMGSLKFRFENAAGLWRLQDTPAMERVEPVELIPKGANFEFDFMGNWIPKPGS
jgi:hypothetical protein